MPAVAPSPSFARRLQQPHRQRQARRARRHGRRSSASPAWIGSPIAAERRGAQPDAEDEREDAVGAVPAVAHDRQLLLAVAAAAEPVGGVGEPVLVQRAGERKPAATSASSAATATAEPEQSAPKTAPARRVTPIPAPTAGNAQPAAAMAPSSRRCLHADRQPGQHRGRRRRNPRTMPRRASIAATIAAFADRCGGPRPHPPAAGASGLPRRGGAMAHCPRPLAGEGGEVVQE